MTDLEEDNFEGENGIKSPTHTKFKHIVSKEIYTHSNRHYDKIQLTKEDSNYYSVKLSENNDSLLNKIYLVLDDISDFSYFCIKNKKCILEEMCNKTQIKIGMNWIDKNTCELFPYQPIKMKSSLEIVLNVPGSITIIYDKITNDELRRYKVTDNEEIIPYKFFVEIKKELGQTIKWTPPKNMHFQAINIRVAEDTNQKFLTANFDGMKFINSTDPLYNMVTRNNQYIHMNFCELKCSKDYKDYLYANGSYIVNKTKSINISGLYNLEHTTITIMFTTIAYLRNYRLIKEILLFERSNNNYPLTKINNSEFIEGYWHSHYSKYIDEYHNYPFPVESIEKNSVEFMDKLTNLISYLDKLKQYETFLGSSYSRLTNENVGGKEYYIENNGIKFRFPESITHYYCDHNVKPSDEFYKFIMDFSFPQSNLSDL